MGYPDAQPTARTAAAAGAASMPSWKGTLRSALLVASGAAAFVVYGAAIAWILDLSFGRTAVLTKVAVGGAVGLGLAAVFGAIRRGGGDRARPVPAAGPTGQADQTMTSASAKAKSR